MHASPLRPLHALTLAVSLGAASASALGCTAVLDPERIDGLARCEYDRDCPASDDDRWSQTCVETEGEGGKVCAPAFTPLSCDPYDYDPKSRFRTRYEEANAVDGRYEYNCQNLGGVKGCEPDREEGCKDGLVVDSRSGRCDDEDPLTPPALAPETFLGGQDVRDQFCRAFFCDETFVCNTRHGENREDVCVPCTFGEPIGFGGCGELHMDGERSHFYQDQDELERNCQAPNVDPESIEFEDWSEG